MKEVQRKLSTSLETIKKIGAQGIPIVTALNKIDLLPEAEIQQQIEAVKELAPNPVAISALTKTNINLLKRELVKALRKYVNASFSIPLSDKTLAFLSWLFNYSDVRSVKYENDLAEVTFEAEQDFADKVLGRVESYGGKAKELIELR